MLRKLLTVLAVLTVTCFPAAPAASQSAGSSVNEILARIHQLRRERVVTNATVGPTIAAVVNGMIDLEDREATGLIKRRLATTISRARLKKLAEAANPPDGLLLVLFHTTAFSVRNNLTDAGLKAAVTQNGRAVKQRAARAFGSRVLPKELLRVLESYTPERAARVLDAAASLAFLGSDLPQGAPGTTWASRSFWEVNFAARKVEFARRSVAAKLLANLGVTTLPERVEARFVWSGWPPIPIDLSIPRWTEADIEELSRLLDHPYYGDAARAQLDGLQ